jgi:hypothetical protein
MRYHILVIIILILGCNEFDDKIHVLKQNGYYQYQIENESSKCNVSFESDLQYITKNVSFFKDTNTTERILLEQALIEKNILKCQDLDQERSKICSDLIKGIKSTETESVLDQKKCRDMRIEEKYACLSNYYYYKAYILNDQDECNKINLLVYRYACLNTLKKIPKETYNKKMCTDKNLHDTAVRLNNAYFCTKISDIQEKINCFDNIIEIAALKTLNPKICNYKEKNKEFCIKNIDLSILKKNSSFDECNIISNRTLRIECNEKSKMLELFLNNNCIKIKTSKLKDICFFDRGRNFKEKGACNNISNSNMKRACLGIVTQNKELCNVTDIRYNEICQSSE